MALDAQLRHYQERLDFQTDPSDLFEALRAGAAVVALDARRPEAHQVERIPGSLNLPHREICEATTQGLDRGTLYVAYCDGIGCNASTRGALALARLGFRVRELVGGLEWWKRDGYATEGARASPGARADRTDPCGC